MYENARKTRDLAATEVPTSEATIAATPAARRRRSALLARSWAALILVVCWFARLWGTREARELRPGAMVGRYRIRRKLGEGGMGAVWEAEAPSGLRVALKVMHDDRGADADTRARARARFRREAAISSELSSPHIAQLLEARVDATARPYLVMEQVPGASLRTLIDRDGPLSPARTADVLSQLCLALRDVHRAGIVHRDIKPDNVLYVRSATSNAVKLIDFGVASPVETEQDDRLTRENIVVGTPQYLPPESIFGAVSSATDIYAIGCLAYFLLTGRSAFTGPTPAEVFYAHLKGQRPSLPSAVPAALAELIEACLQKEPALRPSAIFLADAFSALSRQLGDAGRSFASTYFFGDMGATKHVVEKPEDVANVHVHGALLPAVLPV